LTNSRIDGLVNGTNTTATATPGLTIVGNLELNGRLEGQRSTAPNVTPQFRFAAGSSLSGTGQIGNIAGRIQGTVVEIMGADFTVPVGITLISATPYDSADVIEAPGTNLVVDGRIVTGYTSQFNNAVTDSWTFHVASLRTTGDVQVTSDGRIDVQGGPWHHAGHLTFGGGRISAEAMSVEAAGVFEGWGTIDLGAAGLNVKGIFAPGTAQGQLVVNGDANLAPTATLAIELRGRNNSNPASPQFDQLQVAGELELAGLLDVTLGGGFTPVAGDAFDILNWGTLTGIYNSFHLPALGGLIVWYFSVIYTGGVLSVVAPSVPGDFNLDGTVDAADYVTWRAIDGSPEGYDAWRAHFGQLASGSGSGTPVNPAVPEPSTLALLTLGLVAIYYRRVSLPCWVRLCSTL
jgi:hypothetical protein